MIHNERLIAVHDGLLAWCERFGEGQQPVPQITISGYASSLSIGEVSIWCSESGYADDVTRDDGLSMVGAIECYKNLIGMMSRWPV